MQDTETWKIHGIFTDCNWLHTELIALACLHNCTPPLSFYDLIKPWMMESEIITNYSMDFSWLETVHERLWEGHTCTVFLTYHWSPNIHTKCVLWSKCLRDGMSILSRWFSFPSGSNLVLFIPNNETQVYLPLPQHVTNLSHFWKKSSKHCCPNQHNFNDENVSSLITIYNKACKLEPYKYSEQVNWNLMNIL